MNYTQLQAALHRANIAMPLPWGMPTLQPTAFCCSSCVGAALVDILTHLGLDAEWDGSPNKCIRLRGVDGSDFRSWVAANTPDDDDDDDDDW